MGFKRYAKLTETTGGNQQFTTRNLIFIQPRTAIQLLWDWGWTWKSVGISGSQYGVRMQGDFRGGSILLLDSKMTDVTTGIFIDTPKGGTPSEEFSITIDNLELTNVGTTVSHQASGTTLGGGSRTIDSWMLGKYYDQATPNGQNQNGGALSSLHPKTASLQGPLGGYFERSKNQYIDVDASVFLNARIGAAGKL